MFEQMHVTGASIALVSHDEQAGYDEVLAIQRDNIPSICFPNMWEFPGGGIDPGEAPVECALRELWEETGLRLDPTTIIWEAFYQKRKPLPDGSPIFSGFYVARVTRMELPELHKGDEGQSCRWMRSAAFLGYVALEPEGQLYCEAIPDHIGHFTDYYRGMNSRSLTSSGTRTFAKVA